MVSGTKQVKKINIWSTIYTKKFIDAFKGKKQGNILNLLGSISILGESQTSDMSKFVLSYGETKGVISELRYSDYRLLQSEYSRLLTGRSNKLHGGKKIVDEFKEPKKNPNPVKLGYVIITGKPESTKGNPTPQYFLTLKGFFLILGYDLTSSELRLMINNASKISLFFCFIKTVMDNSSVDFVTEIFIKPIQKVLLRSDIFQGGKMDFYFSNFADAISASLSEKMTEIFETRKKNILDQPVSYFYKKITLDYRRLHPTKKSEDLIYLKIKDELKDAEDILYHFKKEGIESLMDNVFDSSNSSEDWYDSLFDYFYPSKESRLLFLKFGYDSEKSLLYKVMQSISYVLTSNEYHIIGYTPKKLPRSKAWKRNQRYKKPDKAFFKKYGSKFKLPADFDLSHLD